MRAIPLRAGLLGALLASALPGCLEAPGEDEAIAHLAKGTFVEDRTDADRQAFSDLIERYGGEAIILTTIPATFRVIDLSARACVALQEALGEADYVAEVSACEAHATSDLGG